MGHVQLMPQLIEDLLRHYWKIFIWKFSATSHCKGVKVLVIHGLLLGHNIKSNVRCKVMSMKKGRPIIQDSEKLAQMLVPSTKIK